MNCEKCGTETVYNSIGKEVAREDIINKITKYNIPFVCEQCGGIDFPYIAVRDVVFLYPLPKPIKHGSIILVDDDDFSGGSFRESIWEARGVLMSIGEGYIDKRGVLHKCSNIEPGDIVGFHKKLPDSWKNFEVLDKDGNKHIVVYCGYRDLFYREIIE